MNIEEIDAVDVGSGIVSLCIVAANMAITPLYAIPVGLGWWILHSVRHSPAIQEWADRVSSGNKIAERVVPLLLSAPKEEQSTEISIKQDKPFDVRVTNTTNDKVPWSQRITQPIDYTPVMATATITKGKQQKMTSGDNLAALLKRAPKYISYEKLPEAPTCTSVLIGYDIAAQKWLWADFGHDGDTLHALIAGQTGAGKDSELRLWFTQLTSNNSPDDVKFVVLDGKGEWLTPALMNNPHMLVKPAGGVELVRDEKGKWTDLANERIEDAIGEVFSLIADRNEKFQKVGATNVSTYFRKTGEKLPLIFVIMTDVGTNIEAQLETLVKMLTFKGRSFGIRLIVSMQTASGQDTGWRGQLALAMSGFQQIPQADAPNLGIPVRAMIYRPSELPSVDEPSNRGLFVVRKGSDQVLIKAVHLPDEVFEEYCERQVNIIQDSKEVDDLLSNLMRNPVYASKPIEPPKPKATLTKEQAQRIAQLAHDGKNKTEIMYELGFMNSAVYKTKGPAVEMIIKAVRAKQKANNRLDV